MGWTDLVEGKGAWSRAHLSPVLALLTAACVVLRSQEQELSYKAEPALPSVYASPSWPSGQAVHLAGLKVVFC